MSRIEVRFAFAEAVLLGLVLVALWFRLLRGSRLSFGGVTLCLAGLIVGVSGTVRETTYLSAIGLALLGTGWIMCGVAMRRRGRPGLAFLTVALGFFALLGAVDRGLLMLPLIPVPPSVWRIVLELFWVPASIIAAIRGRFIATSLSDPAPATGDPLERFTSRLRF